MNYVDAHHHIWRVQDLPWFLGGVRVVEIHEPPAVDGLSEDREVPADLLHIERHGGVG